MRKIKGGEEIRYLIDKENPTGYSQVIEERGNSGEVKRRYVYGYDLISMTDVSTNKTYYYVYDGIGSVRCVLDEGGNIVNEYDYDGFGVILNERETITNAYKFHGEYMDEDTGLYYLRVRWYDVDTGRFYSMDEFEGVYEEPESLHKYVFAGNDGVNRVDYSGMYYGIASVGVAIGMAGILAGIAENVWADIGVKSKEKIIKRLIQYFYDASKETGIDIDVLGSLAWSESGNGRLGYWDRNLNSTDDPNDVGIMRINSKIWGPLTKYYAYKGMSDKENILKGAKLLKEYCMPKAKKYINKGSFGHIKIRKTEDILLVTIWVYKGQNKKRHAIFWRYYIYIQWPKVKRGERTSLLLQRLWKNRYDFLKK